MTARKFWPIVIATFAVLAVISRWMVAAESYPVVLATLAITFFGACVGAALLLVRPGSPHALLGAITGRSVVTVAGVVLIWLFMEPPVKPLLGALVLGYTVFLVIETALAYSLATAKKTEDS